MTSLKLVDLSGSASLVLIDENAFGYAKNSKGKAPIEVANFEDCAVSKWVENLLPWEKMNGTFLAGNPLDCGKGLDWLKNNDKIHLYTSP
jgi:hypothetical protein